MSFADRFGFQPWMVADPGPVRQAGLAYYRQAEAAGRLAREISAQLGDTATTLGWSGQAASSAAGSGAEQRAALVRCEDAFRAAGDIITTFAVQMSVMQEPLLSLSSRIGLEVLSSGAPLDGLIAEGLLSPAAEAAPMHLREAQSQAALALQGVINALGALSQPSTDWMSGLVAGGQEQTLVQAGLLFSQSERVAIQQARAVADDICLRDPHEQAQRVREALLPIGTDRLSAVLVANPDLASVLMQDRRPPWGTGRTDALGAPENEIFRVQAWYATLSAEEARRVTLLNPWAAGRTDGVPLSSRADANRVAMAVESASLHAQQADPGAEVLSPEAAERVKRRIALLDRLIFEVVPNPAPAPGRPDVIGHQVVLFDAEGDGRIAEMWGAMDEHTRHVAVMVPGTGSELDNFGGQSRLARQFTRDAGQGPTTVISWLGGDEPDTIPEARHTHYAKDGAQSLVNFVDGMGTPGDADVTAIGHSYGGSWVGTAAAEGMRADQVVLVESPGMGPAVTGVQDYPHPKRVFSMTAPGDPIRVSRPFGDGYHGANPDTTPGVIQLETGRYLDGPNAGERIQGFPSHSGVFGRDTTSYNNIIQVVRGEPVILDSPPLRYDSLLGPIEVDPYQDPAFEGPETPIEDLP